MLTPNAAQGLYEEHGERALGMQMSSSVLFTKSPSSGADQGVWVAYHDKSKEYNLCV